jgi:small ligand-binding sensory domain FIST
MDAASFEARSPGAATEPVVEVVSRVLSEVRSPRLVLAFACGSVARELSALGAAIATRTDAGVPVVLGSGSGVLSERGAIEDDSAVTGLVIGGGRPLSVACRTGSGGIDELLARAGPALVLVRSEDASIDTIAIDSEGPILGAGTVGNPGLVLARDGRSRRAVAVLVELPAALCPLVRVAHGCRLLGEFFAVTEASGRGIFELDGKPALARLSDSGRGLTERAPLLMVLARTRPSGPEDWLVRPIVGVDPDRGGVFVGPEATRASYAAFAVRDGTLAEEHVASCCRTLKRELHGSAPRCGLYFSAAPRARSPYGGANVDVRAIGASFGGMPCAGLQGAFQLGPLGLANAAQLYAGVLGVLRHPS